MKTLINIVLTFVLIVSIFAIGLYIADTQRINTNEIICK